MGQGLSFECETSQPVVANSASYAPVPRRTAHALATICVLGILLVFNWPVLIGHAYPVWDGDRYFLPFFSLLSDCARHWELLTWDPWSWCGQPAFTDPQIGALSPITLAFAMAFGGSAYGYGLYVLAMWAAGPIGMILLGKRLGVPAWAAFVGAVGYTFSSFYISNLQHPSWVVSCSSIPWIIAFADTAVRERRLLPGLQACCIWGLSALSGYPALTLASAGLASVWSISRFASARERLTTGRTISTFAGVLLCTSVGVMVLAPSYVSFFYEGAGANARTTGIDKHTATTTGALHPGAVSSFGSPAHVAISSIDTAVFPGSGFFGVSLFCGIVPAVCSVCIFVLPRRQKRHWGLAMGASLFVVLALGAHTPVRGWLYEWFPVFRLFRFPSLFIGPFTFLLCTLGMMAVPRVAIYSLSGSVSGRTIRALLTVVLATSIGVSVLSLVSDVELTWRERVLIYCHLSLWGALAVLQLAGAYAPGIVTIHRAVHCLIIISIIDAGLSMGINANAYTWKAEGDSTVARWATLESLRATQLAGASLLNRRSSSVYSSLTADGTCNDNLVLKVPVLQNYTVIPPWPFGARPTLYVDQSVERNLAYAVGEKRFFFSQQPVFGPPSMSAYENTVTGETGGPMNMIVHTPDEMLAGPSRASYDQIQTQVDRIGCEVVSYGPSEMLMRVSVIKPGWLLVTDRWSRSWVAYVDGLRTDVYGANCLFRAIKLTAGTHTVRFSYEIPWFWPMLFVSWLLIGLCLLLGPCLLSIRCLRPHLFASQPRDR